MKPGCVFKLTKNEPKAIIRIDNNNKTIWVGDKACPDMMLQVCRGKGCGSFCQWERSPNVEMHGISRISSHYEVIWHSWELLQDSIQSCTWYNIKMKEQCNYSTERYSPLSLAFAVLGSQHILCKPQMEHEFWQIWKRQIVCG